MINTARCVFLAVLIFCTDNTKSLNILKLEVPEYIQIGSKVYLCCMWKLDPAERLYSIKWYKDGKEFYRYVPRDSQPHKMFLLAGVRVEKFDSIGSKIVLSPASLETEGRYRCEVSGERPNFLTSSKYADLVVVVLPDQGPVVTQLRSGYKVGDRIQVNCSSGRSRPKTTLAWYINNIPACAQYVLESIYTEHEDGLTTSTLALDFKINGGFYANKEFKLKCLASVPYLYWKSNEVISTVITSPKYRSTSSTNSLHNAKNLYSETKSHGNSRFSTSLHTFSFLNTIIFIIFFKII